MTQNELQAWALGEGWTPDAYGHMHKGDLRFKFQATSVRLERSYHTPDTQYSKGEKRWVRLASAYYSKLKLVDGKLQGLKR